jgi:hypothetical protein
MPCFRIMVAMWCMSGVYSDWGAVINQSTNQPTIHWSTYNLQPLNIYTIGEILFLVKLCSQEKM